MPTKKKSKLSKARQKLAVEYMPLVRMLSRYFVSQRPGWQRSAMIPDLESEGYLALSKAAITYDKKKLPYPKAYFARAVLNAMCKFMRKITRSPGERVAMSEAEHQLRTEDELDHLRLAIEGLDEADQEFAAQRFIENMTLRQLSEENDSAMRIVTMKNRRLMKELAEKLDIRLPMPGKDSCNRWASTCPKNSSGSQACESLPGKACSQFSSKTNPGRPAGK